MDDGVDGDSKALVPRNDRILVLQNFIWNFYLKLKTLKKLLITNFERIIDKKY